MQDDLPRWLQSLIVCGREDDGDNDEDNEDGNENDEDNNDDGEDGGDGGDKGGDSGDGDNDLKARADALEESLKKERKLRRQAERDARKAAKVKETSQEEKDSTALRKQLEDQEAKTKRLAAGLRSSAVDNAILEAARKAQFIDPTDALLDDVRKEVDVDQDDDDPSDIDIDLDTVKDAVKKLANKKKHLIGEPGEGERSGGKFRRRSRSGDEDSASEQALVTNYPSLRS